MIDQMKVTFYRDRDDKRVAIFVMLNTEDDENFEEWFGEFVTENISFNMAEDCYEEYVRTWRPDPDGD